MVDNHDSDNPEDPETQVSGADHHHRMRFEWNDLMEDLIEDGRRRGLFDDLSGKGKPLELEQNFYEGSNALANQLMKANAIRPAWLSLRLGLTDKIDAHRADMQRTWERYSDAIGHSHSKTHLQSLALGWEDVIQRWQQTIIQINKEIDTYNLKRPQGQRELLKLRLEDELRRIDAPRYIPTSSIADE